VPATKPVFISVNQISSSSNPALLTFTQLFNVSTAPAGGAEEDELLLLQDKNRLILRLKNRILLIF
jgi:hypothetical protein